MISVPTGKKMNTILNKISALKTISLVVGAALVSSVTLATEAAAQRGAYPVRIDTGGESDVSQSIVLPLNKAAIVELPRGASDVLVSQPTVVDAVVRSPRRVYLLGLSVGQTNAFFFDAQGKQILNLEIQVERDLDDLTALFSRVMPDSRIVAEAVNDNIILSGVVNSSVEAANAADLAGRFIGDPLKVVSMLSIRDREQVMLKVRIVEMARSTIKQLGVDTSGVATLSSAAFEAAATTAASSGSGGGLTAVGSRFFGANGNSSLDVSFQALEQIGLIRTLAEPNLTAVSGESANFLAGGEFPIPVGQEDGVISIEFKEFGVGLGFTPIVLGKGRINLKMSTEVSELTTENGFSIASATQTIITGGEEDEFILVPNVNDPSGFSFIPNPNFDPAQVDTQATPGLTIPGLTVRRAKTTVELPSGGSLVMAGLLQEDMRQTIDGVPGLKDIPLLGQLFRSRDYQNAETELVIIVTPYIVEPTHKSALADPAEGLAPATDLQTIFLGKMISTYGHQGSDVQDKTLQGPLGFILD
ncbi:MAG: type II and III secretion system protein family protein [Pseudomonadota bacterium]